MDANTIGIIVGVVGVVIGVSASYYFYRKSLRNKEPYVSFSENNLIRGYISEFEGLEVLYKGHKVENLTVSKILFWNDGSETISRSDITTTDPIRVIGNNDNIRILDVKVLTSNNPANQFSCALSDDMKEVKIDFDYLDQRQGAIMQAVHTGLHSGISVSGTIKGVKSIRVKEILFGGIDEGIILRRVFHKVNPSTRRFIAFFLAFCGVYSLFL